MKHNRWRLTMRQKLVIGLGVTVLLISVVTLSAYINHQRHIAIKANTESVERLHEVAIMLQLAVAQALMSPNDYLIHGHHEERVSFERLATNVKTHLKEFETLEKAEEANESDVQIFTEIWTRFNYLKEIARSIFALSKPIGDQNAARQMEEMDHLGEQIIADIDRLHTRHAQLLQERQQIIQQVEHQATIAMIGGGSGAIVVALLLGFFLSRSLMHPVVNLIAGLRRIASGDLSHRVPVETDDEIGMIACEVNAMAEKLNTSREELLVTHRKLQEVYDEILQADKMASLGLIAGTVAHDIANPLAVILGEVQMLQMKQNIDRQHIEGRCRLIEQQGWRIDRLLQSIRTFARKSTGELHPTNVHEPIEEALILTGKLLSTHQVNVVKDFTSDLPLVMADPNRLEQVFMNLFQNAAQIMPNGGTITITTRHYPKSSETANGREGERDWVEVVVADTGPGIPDEHRDRIFEAFFTTKPSGQGTGLGLAICRRIVHEHGGEISVHSDVGKGAYFTVLFPTINA